MPKGWREATIGDVAMVNPRRPASLRSLPDNHNVTFVPMPAVDEHSGTIATPTVRPFKEVKKGFTCFAENDVIFAKITPCMQNGKSAIARGLANGLGMGSTEFHVLRCDPETVLPEWIWYFVRNPVFRTEATYHFRGAVGQQRVPADFVAQHPIPVPPLDEQRRIVGRIREMMERVDRVVGLRTQRKCDIDALVPATLDDVFCAVGGTETPLFDLLLKSPQNGLYLPKSEYDSAGVPMVHMGDMFRRFELTGSPEKRVHADADLVAKYGLSDTDVLVARRSLVFEGSGSMTLVGPVVEPTLFESSIIRLQPNTELIHPAYLVSFFYSREGTRRRLRITRKATISGVNQKGLATLTVPVPSLGSQQTALERINDIRLAHAKLGEFDPAPEVERLPASILRKAFAGEL
ncbi:MAG: restriction endonuclease subunit S [Polyangiaceae bacterium]